MTDVVVVTTTVDSLEVARQLAHTSVTARFAACAQITGVVESVYRWQGVVESAQEWLVLFKTTRQRYPALAEHLRAAHPYDVPEIISTPVTAGAPDYLAWVEEQTQSAE